MKHWNIHIQNSEKTEIAIQMLIRTYMNENANINVKFTFQNAQFQSDFSHKPCKIHFLHIQSIKNL